MSLDLQLHPSMDRKMSEWILGVTRLVVSRDGWAHCVRASEHRKVLPNGTRFEYYDDEGSYDTRHDQHGEITWMTAQELLSVPMMTPDDNEEVEPGTRTRATLAYLREIHPDTPVVLYFH